MKNGTSSPSDPNPSQSHFARVLRLFELAQGLPSAERDGMVRSADADAATITDVLSLLRMSDAEVTEWIRRGSQGSEGGARAAKPSSSLAGEKVQSTATGELLEKLAKAPKLDEQRFSLEGEVGKGGMGAVLKIHDRFLNRRLAMKVLLERPAPRDESERKLAHQLLGRFLEEAQVTSQLDHPGVVPVHELGLDANGKVWFTMRLVKGRTASQVFADAFAETNDWTLTRALEVVLKVCDTMSYAHEKGVIHRDLKPANVMVGRFGEVYVMDWGLAKVLGQQDRHDLRIRADASTGASRLETVRKQDADDGSNDSIVTMDGQQLGTPSYMSPEQARSEDTDYRADVYAVGAMLYELVTGAAPYVPHGMRKPAYQILEDVVVGPPRSVAELRKDVPRELRRVIERAMARDVQKRYGSMGELAAALRAAISKPFRMWVRRNKILAVSIVVSVLFLVGGVVVSLTQWIRAESARADAEELAAEKGLLAASEAQAKEGALAEKRRADAAALDKGRTLANFNQLAAVVRIQDALVQQQQLWPAGPDKVAALQAWIDQDCAQLLAQRPQIEATIAELGSKAVPLTAEQVEVERRAAADWPAYERQRQLVASLRRAQAIRSGQQQLVVPEMTPEQQALGAKALNALAWPRVAPKAEDRTVWGDEALGLAAARAAVLKAGSSDDGYQYLNTLVWALLANGQDEEARQRTTEALAKAPTSEREVYLGYQRDLEGAIAEAPTRLAAAEANLAALDAKVSVRRTWTFGGDEEGRSAEFLHNTLLDVLARLGAMEAKERADVAQRLTWAQQVEAASINAHRARWAEASLAILRADGVTASALYRAAQIDLPPQIGLVPIGMNPVTKLWEFYDLRSAWDGEQPATDLAIPTHRDNGTIEVTEDTGIVFVLLPGGVVTLGSQNEDSTAPYFDPQRRDDEKLRDGDETLHVVTLSPFLLARHEMTQRQWSRLWTWDADGRDPSRYTAGKSFAGRLISGTNPVEQVDWQLCDQLLTRHGMVLPTEAQWECGCRGGTTTPWFVPLEELRTVANLADADAKRAAPVWTCELWSDGHVVHAPVGSFRFNSFGLHDAHGNVWEWCRDGYGVYGSERAGDGMRTVGAPSLRVIRGGSFGNPAANARAAGRMSYASLIRNDNVGLRPARLIQP